MRKNEIKIVNEAGQEATVIKSAFEKVWAARGWVKKEIEKVEADTVAEVDLVEASIEGQTPPPASTAAAPVVQAPAAAAARLGRADGGTGAVESTQTPS